MIDLSQFVDKKVRVTLRNGGVEEGFVKSTLHYDYPFSINLNYYSNNGEWKHSEHRKYDIIQIEEIKPMNKYEELEKQVAEMQKEIDRLKGEEEKNNLNLKPVEITRTVKITPEDYYEYCKEYKEKPTATGYVKYYSSSAWFMDSGDYTESFKVIGE